jgi:hypothetical protein
LTRRGVSSSDLADALPQFDEMHNQMTELVAQALNDGTPISVSLTNTLNALISSQATRLAAFRDRLPVTILLLLLVSAIVTALLIGREQGKLAKAEILGTLCFILLVSLTVFVTLDLNRPESGLIRVSQEPMVRLLSSMSK